MTTDVEFYKAIQARQEAAFSALGLLRSMVIWDAVPAPSADQAREIIAAADAADKVLAES